jgi:hypothetical protein
MKNHVDQVGDVRNGARLTFVNRALAGAVAVAAALIVPPAALASWPTPPPPLPAPTGNVVNVSTEAQLRAAVSSIASGTTIVVAPGTYNLTETLYFKGAKTDIGIRGATNNAADVVLVGRGMSNDSYGSVPHGIWTGDGVNRILIANLTIKNVYYHPIALNPGTASPHIYNVHLIDAGEQFIKASSGTDGTDFGKVEYSRFEYTTTAKNDYTNAIDVHKGQDWVIRNNYFKNIRAPQGQLAGPAILMWNNSTDTLVEGNTFINCQREIALGLIERTPNDHERGIVRNNFIFRSSGVNGDTAIGVFDSPGTRVFNNTVILSGDYPYAIEYRWSNTTGVYVANNLTDAAIRSRDGGSGTSTNNVTSATTALFVNAAAGDLHLKSTATLAIDKGIAVSGLTDDWDGSSRPVGGANDVGADEYGGSTTTAPAAPTNLRILR